MKPTGSEIFDTDVIRTDEYILLAQIKIESGITTQQAALEIDALDDMLSMQRMRPIITKMQYTSTGKLRKDAKFSQLLSNRLDLLMTQIKELP